MVPLLNVEASAGSGLESENESPLGLLPLPSRFVKRVGLHAIYARGDSMAPNIKDDDILLVDTSDKVLRDAIFVIRVDGGLSVKRLMQRPGGKIEVRSDNPACGGFVIDANSPA